MALRVPARRKSALHRLGRGVFGAVQGGSAPGRHLCTPARRLPHRGPCTQRFPCLYAAGVASFSEECPQRWHRLQRTPGVRELSALRAPPGPPPLPPLSPPLPPRPLLPPPPCGLRPPPSPLCPSLLPSRYRPAQDCVHGRAGGGRRWRVKSKRKGSSPLAQGRRRRGLWLLSQNFKSAARAGSGGDNSQRRRQPQASGSWRARLLGRRGRRQGLRRSDTRRRRRGRDR
mmetsp:Transcript_9277/g.21179  ORF Transcript_9277/g.21179 Transcript_9277/m.21179 type:complete len:229 (+) Transcript_9277:220-906(+)